MRARMFEIGGGLLLGLMLMGASVGAMSVMGRLIEAHGEVAR